MFRIFFSYFFQNFAIIILARAYLAVGTILFDNFDRGYYCTVF